MRKHVERRLGFFKTTALGGVVFLLPLIVVGALLAQAGQIVWGVVDAVRNNPAVTSALPVHTPAGYAALVAATIAGLVAICFACGMLARRSLGRWFTNRAERYLTMLFPRYAVFKDQLTGNLGGEIARGGLRPVVAKVGPVTRLGVEVERGADGRVTVYLPSAPDPWTGSVVILSADEVSPVEAEFVDVMTTFEKLGRGTSAFVEGEAGLAEQVGQRDAGD